MYELLNNNCLLESSLLDHVPNLKAYQSRIEAVPTLAAYMKSENYISKCVNGPFTNWGN